MVEKFENMTGAQQMSHAPNMDLCESNIAVDTDYTTDKITSQDTFQHISQAEMDDIQPEITILNNDSPQSSQDSSTVETDNDDIIMSAFWRCGKFAAAYFNTNTSELFILNEIRDVISEFNMLKKIYRQVQPMLVIIDPHSAKSFVDCLKSLISERQSDTSSNSNVNKLSSSPIFFPTKEYNLESCRRRIYLLQLPNEPPNASDQDREMFLNSIINFRYFHTIYAAGALLKYLDKNWCRLNVNNSVTPSILSVNILTLDKVVTMDDESYKALQIFNKLPHPSNFKKGTAQSSKEGLSLFAIFNRCCSKVGVQHLNLILQHPTNDIKVLQRRLDTIEFCNKPGNEEIIKSICSSLKYIKNVNGIMTKIITLHATPLEWKLFFNTLYHAVIICEICESYSGSSSLIDALASRNNDNLFQVAHHMSRIIDFELSNIQGKFTVKLGIDPELDKKKQTMMGLHGLMSTTAKFELEKLPTFIEECTMVYLPNLGYLLGVKAWKTPLDQTEKDLPNLRFMFQNDDCIYYKSVGCEELDHLIGDTYPEISAHEMGIMMNLTEFILKHFHPLSTVVKLCAELDCIISLAKVCKDNDYRRPVLTFDKVIDINKGRHPLQELCVDSYVENDTKSMESECMVTVLTGPNSCGKSIYLKQIALIVYMAHIGCYIPAESATIGLINAIYTRVQTTEDISTRMSAFLIDIRQMSNAIRNLTSASLVIIDEFGKGTSEVDGLALLAASINNFLFHESKCPHVFVSTHYHNLKQYLVQSPLLKMMTMEYFIQNKILVFLYKLIEGSTESSFALQVAENSGVDEDICIRAKCILDHLKDNYLSTDSSLKSHKLQSDLIKLIKQNIDEDVHTIINKMQSYLA